MKEQSEQNKVCLLTGATGGIGRAVSALLLERGWTVVALGRSLDRLQELQKRWGERLLANEIDFAQLDRLPQLLQNILAEHPTPAAVVCAAGQGRFGSLEEFSYNQIRGLMEVNFTSQAYVARAVLPVMKRAGRGDLVFIGSEAALSGGRKGALYCASKFALRGLAQALRDECARSGVRIGLVNPGMVRTAFFDELSFEPGDEADQAIEAGDVAAAVLTLLEARPGTVIDEINLSPQKKTIKFKP